MASDVAVIHAAQKSLAGVWGKLDVRKSPPQLEKGETYELEFPSDTAWIAVRTNATGPSKFKLSYDKATHLLWWGGSYFMDPSETSGSSSDKVNWYKRDDKAKKRPAFAWKKLQEGTPPLRPSVSRVASKAQPTAAPKMLLQRPQTATGPMPPPPAFAKPEPSSAVSGGSAAAVGGGSNSSSSKRPQPEVILDLEQILVIYKPPYWKCELPEKGKEKALEDPTLLPQWLAARKLGISAKLFEESFNPALSGTGFGPLAHRIDVETSGPLLITKTANAQRHLKSQFHKTEISKRYVCLVHGRVVKDAGKIDVPIRTMRTDFRTRSEVSSQGEWAETNFEVVARYEAPHRKVGDVSGGSWYSLVACDIKSGRTHQIRVHMLHLGHPLISDDKYQAKDDVLVCDRKWCNRLFLHAFRLQFRDTRNEVQTVVCPLPEDLKRALLSLGAASASSDAQDRDNLYGETSWQREVFRPAVTQWRPATRVLRKMVELMSLDSEPMPLARLNADFPELREAMDDEDVRQIDKAWLSKHWDIFEIAPPFESLGGTEESKNSACVRLRPAYAASDGNPENDLEKEIEKVRFEIEDLERQKQRAVAQEEYKNAGDLKRRIEVLRAEFESLEAFMSLDEEGGTIGVTKTSAARREQRAVEAFKHDVGDEALFPSLPSAPSRSRSVPRTSSTGGVVRSPSSTKAVGSSTSSAGGRAASAAPLRSISVDAGGASAHSGLVDVGPAPPPELDKLETQEKIPVLLDALVEFLEGRDQGLAHINEVNNDKTLRKVMAAQKPKVTAINKLWLKKHEDKVALLRAPDGEMYLALERPKEKESTEKHANVSAAAPKALQAPSTQQQQPKTVAYRQVIQKTSEDAPALVYSYSAADRQKAAQEGGNKISNWQEKFLAALRQSPESDHSSSAEDLLAAVPSFAEAMGAKKPQESKELLVMFLQGCPDVFKVEKKGAGASRQYLVRPR